MYCLLCGGFLPVYILLFPCVKGSRAAARIKQQSRCDCKKTGGVYLGFFTSGGRKFPHGNFRTTRVLRSQNTPAGGTIVPRQVWELSDDSCSAKSEHTLSAKHSFADKSAESRTSRCGSPVSLFFPLRGWRFYFFKRLIYSRMMSVEYSTPRRPALMHRS